jgi:hypothetical protein
MKKLAISVIGLLILSVGFYSCTKEKNIPMAMNNLKSGEFVDPTIGLSLSFHPTEDAIPTGVYVKVGKKWTINEIGKSHRKNYDGQCSCFGLCGKKAMQPNEPTQFPKDYIGRYDIVSYITQNDIDNEYFKIYQMQDISFLPIEHQSFNINSDIDDGDGIIVKKGIYPLDMTLGQYGGYKVNFKYNK